MLYDILKDFPGSQDGRFTEQFTAGTQRDLSDYLAAIVVPAGWARPAKPAQAPLEIDNKALVSDGSHTGAGGGGMRRNRK
jgi:hypothetical protein